ncbi:SAM-dependent methyltransferase [Nocardia noduli]|uniref:SAM-dependent methyltransferase n=1 Tax=Nocardia noduli TaxID=2815722 RepID=UPI001C24563F|nr:SAM-dependent methyltransferase [Nocardia noduli]
MGTDRDTVPGARDLDREFSGPVTARVLDAILPYGKDNYETDQDVASQLPPAFKAGVQAGQAFLLHAVGALAAEGVRQFVVVGCGLPRDPNVHAVAAAAAAGTSTLYLDIGHIVTAHGHAMLNRGSRFVQADPGDPASIVSAIDAAALEGTLLGRSQPIAVCFGALILEQLAHARQVMQAIIAALSSGYIVLTHLHADNAPAKAAAETFAEHGLKLWPRDSAAVAALLDGTELLEPSPADPSNWFSTSAAVHVSPTGDHSTASSEAVESQGESSGCCYAAIGAIR